jgi:hypothetical protein
MIKNGFYKKNNFINVKNQIIKLSKKDGITKMETIIVMYFRHLYSYGF